MNVAENRSTTYRTHNLLIISFDFCLEVGGIENTSYLLAEEMTKYMNVFTYCPANGREPQIDGVFSFHSKYTYRGKEKILHYFDSRKIVENIHRQYHIDYVLCVNFICSDPARFLNKKYNVPYGVLAHGNEVMTYSVREILFRPINVFTLIKRHNVLKSATHVFCNTNFTKGLVNKISANKNLYVIHPPIRVFGTNDIPLKKKSMTLLSVGRLIRRKGYQDIIRALPLVLTKIPDLKYVIAGRGEYEKELMNLVNDLELKEHVHFCGRVSEKEKCELLSACDIFVMPSFMIVNERSVEGFGLSMIEANLFGKFVISTFSGGIPEAVIENKTGFLVNEHDIEGLARAITKYYSSDFHFDPQVCIRWGKDHQISVIAEQYWNIIAKCFN